MAHPYTTSCGCSTCCQAEDGAERLDARVAQMRKDPKALAEAESWTAGSFEPEHYSAVSLALHALHRIEPSDLLGSDALANLYRLAKVDHDAIEAQLRSMTKDEVNGQDSVMGASVARFMRLHGEAA